MTLGEGDVLTYQGDRFTVDGTVLTLSASTSYGTLVEYSFGTLVVTNGGSVVCTAQNAGPSYDASAKGVAIKSLGHVVIANGCGINANSQGFGSGKGPGAGSAWSGATYGGVGNNNYVATYGSLSAPTSLGSGSSGVGGGAIKLTVASNLVINGTLGAVGGYDNYAAGAGGSIWISGTCTVIGGGDIQIGGGNTITGSQPGGGGGGRFAVGDAVAWNYAGTLHVAPAIFTGNGNCGGGGSVYFGALARQNFLVRSGQTIQLGGDVPVVFSNLTVNGSLVCIGSCNGQGTGVVVQAVSITVSNTGRITADAWGLTSGPGVGGNWYGGSHGGRGAGNSSNLYGSARYPTSMGSGNGGTPGGGAFKLVVSSNLIMNGVLSANGPDTVYPTGAGGSIWITGGGTLSGIGEIQAYGGSSYNNQGGGGGRICIDDDITYAFGGNIKAGRYWDSTPGTLYLPAGARQDFTIETNQTFIIGNDTNYNFGNLTVKGRLECGGDTFSYGRGLQINAYNLTITSNGTITADDRGFSAGYGPGVGNTTTGATHAGVGYNNPADTYGSATEPIALGSGGPLGGPWDANGDRHGGGAIQLTVIKTARIDGALWANGGIASGYGGCAGGSLWLACGTLTGTGSIRANGGAGTYGGGGGRIAITYNVRQFPGLPLPGLYNNADINVSSSITVAGGYNLGVSGPEDGSIFVRFIPNGTILAVR